MIGYVLFVVFLLWWFCKGSPNTFHGRIASYEMRFDLADHPAGSVSLELFSDAVAGQLVIWEATHESELR
jgi:hypothetical protein